MPRQDKVFVCFQKAEDDTHKLYIYDECDSIRHI